MSDFDHTKIDDVIHGPLRLGVVAYLSTAATASFVELRATVNATDGSLSKQLSRLEDAGYVRIEKTFVGKRPQTLVQLTDTGREAWIAYLTRLEAFIHGSRKSWAFGLGRKSQHSGLSTLEAVHPGRDLADAFANARRLVAYGSGPPCVLPRRLPPLA